MKKLTFCCLCIFALMACGERNAIIGSWSMEIEDTGASSLRMPDDTIVSPQLRFEYDTVYMDVKSNNGLVRSECLGIYTVNGDEMKITDSYGKQQVCRFDIKDNVMIVVDRDDPTKIIMRLRRINGKE